jgi:putative protease
MMTLHQPTTSDRPVSPIVELLAPAGDAACVRAAVENGANAVYFGLNSGFNARARATNLSLEDLPETMADLHRRGVKGYVTLNTLVFCDELPDLERTIRALTLAGVDAVLVQDIGLARLIRGLSPDLPLHASTQFTLTSSEGITVAAELGFERVVLARELSLREIRKIHRQTGMELEAFVHGALCVAYSGQCLTSESLGGRSANRGQCAQACRLPYDLVCDGAEVDLGDQKYLLSPQDLAAYDLTPDLIAAGVSSFKIEGRLKTPEYVANITRHYRQAIDRTARGEPVGITPEQVREMELSFSRGFSPGWLEGCDHKRLVPALSSAKRGVYLGEIRRIVGERVDIQLAGPVRRGDGVVFEGDRAAGEEQGGRIYGVYRKGLWQEGSVSSGVVTLDFARGSLDLARLAVGQALWKTDDPELTARLRSTFTAADPLRRVDLDLRVTAAVGAPLVITGSLPNGVTATVTSESPLAAATKHPMTIEFLREQLGRLGHTVYELREVHATITAGPMVPLSWLSKLRRDLIAELDRRSGEPGPARLHVLCRHLEQVRAILTHEVASITADFQDIREYRQAIAIAREAGKPIWLAPPRIQKPDERGIFFVLTRYAPDGILARNLAGLRFYQRLGRPVVADYSLNATNDLTVAWLREQGARRVTASYDLNRDQLVTLAEHSPPGGLEVVIHQHMPMFHMEHCVFCAVLSPGTNKTNCGRPCDRHTVQLRDRVGMEHPLKADVGCRNTLFNAVPQSGAEVVPDLLARGVRDFRVELLDDTPAEIARLLPLYQQLLNGEVTGEHVWRTLKASNRVGVTRGTLEERRNPLAIL